MQTFIMLTRLISEEVNPTFNVRKKAMDVSEKISSYCPEVKWVADYAILGPWDYVDIFQAPDMETAMRVSALVRHYGGCHTEIWPALTWSSFEDNMTKLIQVMEKE